MTTIVHWLPLRCSDDTYSACGETGTWAWDDIMAITCEQCRQDARRTFRLYRHEARGRFRRRWARMKRSKGWRPGR
jgi:hypothetical protein